VHNEKDIIKFSEIRFLMVGGTSLKASKPNPGRGWLTDK